MREKAGHASAAKKVRNSTRTLGFYRL